MTRRLRSEAGQAAPLYITAVTGLLFLALVFFAFGEADVQRNGAQTAADATALASAKDSRKLLKFDLMAHVMDRGFYTEVFNTPYVGMDGCTTGRAFGRMNDATSVDCHPVGDMRWGYEVELKSKKGMSANLVPGTKGKQASAEAVAVLDNRGCKFVPNPIITSSSIGTVGCVSGLVWVVSPQGLAAMPDMTLLFDVRLAED
ncbi:pilus assembly protein TadG-related protein [Streptomyces sp. NPDC050529]|uniref:pilus assembly protein TadG-related protein n=1 Tax=Streptomyces sp. NPDC050529 TaxID=3365624 RepID=UPI0037A9FC10